MASISKEDHFRVSEFLRKKFFFENMSLRGFFIFEEKTKKKIRKILLPVILINKKKEYKNESRSSFFSVLSEVSEEFG